MRQEETSITICRQIVTSFLQQVQDMWHPHVDRSVVEKIASDTIDGFFGVRPAGQPASLLGKTVAADLQLRFSHDCRSTGCANIACQLCANDLDRGCPPDAMFAAKYIVDSNLLARCKAPIKVELVDNSSGDKVEAEGQLALTLVDAGEHSKQLEAGAEHAAALAAAAGRVTAACDGTPLLKGNGMQHEEVNVATLSFVAGVAYLQGLRFGVSSEKLLGRGAAFQLLAKARLANNSGTPVLSVLSEPFQVLSLRMRSNMKPPIPHAQESVKFVEAIGDATVAKLERIGQAVAGIDLPPECHCVTTVGGFRELVEFAAGNRALEETLRKALGLTKDQWKTAVEHALKAVVADDRPRAWYPDPTQPSCALLYFAKQGKVLLEKPAGILTPTGLYLESQLAAFPAELQQLRNRMEAFVPHAQADWFQPGHRNWTIFDMHDVQQNEPLQASQHQVPNKTRTSDTFHDEPRRPNVLASDLDDSSPFMHARTAAMAADSSSGELIQQALTQMSLDVPGAPVSAPMSSLPNLPSVPGQCPSFSALGASAWFSPSYSVEHKQEHSLKIASLTNLPSQMDFSTSLGLNHVPGALKLDLEAAPSSNLLESATEQLAALADAELVIRALHGHENLHPYLISQRSKSF